MYMYIYTMQAKRSKLYYSYLKFVSVTRQVK